jgi:predicted deacylase
MVLDIHASDMFVRELPQVRISREFSDALMPFAKQMNVDMIWINETDVIHEATLAHTLNTLGVPTMVLELGLGLRIDQVFGNQIVDGIFKLMSEMGIWTGPVPATQMPVISSDGEVEFIRSNRAGIFLPSTSHNHYIIPGQVIGILVNPYTGETCEEIRAKKGGLIFSLRVNPMVYEGSLIARVLNEKEGGIL